MEEPNAEEILSSIEELKKFDSSKYNGKDYFLDIKQEAEPLIKRLSGYGDDVLEYLYHLLDDPSTWTSLLALEIIVQLKSNKSLSFLMNFIKKYDDTKFWDRCEPAMQAIIAIGEPAVEPLLAEVKKDFENKTFNSYLVGALTGIKDGQVYNFMDTVTRDYLADYKKYDGWFEIHMFAGDFPVQGNKEILPVLVKLAEMSNLSSEEKIEIEDTLKIIEDPEAYRKETNEFISRFKEDMEKFGGLGDLLRGKKPKIDKEEILERSETPDKDFEANFQCGDCGERQNLKTGLIWGIEGEYFIFENELMCRKCFGHNLKLSEFGEREIMAKQLRVFMGKDRGVLNTDKKVYTEGKLMNFKKSGAYLQKRMEEEPLNGELCLRFANNLRKNNKYEEAIEYYEKSLDLNPELIASYLNLTEIFLYRHSYYGIEGAREKAQRYFYKMLELFNSNNYDPSTLATQEYLFNFIREASKELGMKVKFKKIGRNEPCPCGSGKKYKKCCLGKEEL